MPRERYCNLSIRQWTIDDEMVVAMHQNAKHLNLERFYWDWINSWKNIRARFIGIW
jgi:hypothetical protein